MSRDEFQHLKGGVVKRKTKRRLGLFIDGVGLDRATRRLAKKVDLSQLVSGLISGIPLDVARYYTLVPYEDDARQFAFLDAVEKAGLEVVIKRLPPKGVKRQVSMDVHMASDLIAFSYGHFNKQLADTQQKQVNGPTEAVVKSSGEAADVQRLALVVCPSRELTYAIYVSHTLGVETSLVDFGLYGTSDGWKGVDRWIDLSTSETIWRD